MRSGWCPNVLWILSAWLVGCTNPFGSLSLQDAGPGSGGCPDGFSACESRCCPAGTQCVSGTCEYPYTTARLHVYLCPSFNTGNCRSAFFALDQACSPLDDAVPGTCYDTGFEVAAGKSYALASCTACGSGCGSPGSFKTPPGFVGPNYYSGFTWSCGAACEAPPDCGGASARDGGLAPAVCSTSDCWLEALSLYEDGQAVPLTAIDRPSLAAGSGTDAPELLAFNGVTFAATERSVSLSSQQADVPVQFDYEFSDPTGCSPGICFSLPGCARNLRCITGTKTVCTHPVRDGALRGSVIRTLGFKAQPTQGSASTELPLEVRLITGPLDPATKTCTDPLDDSDPDHPKLAPDVLIGDLLRVTATVFGSEAPAADAGGAATDAGATSDAAVDSTCCCDFRVTDSQWHCTHSQRAEALCNVPWPDCCDTPYTVCE